MKMSVIQPALFELKKLESINKLYRSWRNVCNKVRYSGDCPKGLKDITNIRPKHRCQSPCASIPEYKIEIFQYPVKNARGWALQRDDYRCRICGSTEGLEVHHINPRMLGGDDSLENLITLCVLCHQLAPYSPEAFKIYFDNAKASKGFRYLYEDKNPAFPKLGDPALDAYIGQSSLEAYKNDDDFRRFYDRAKTILSTSE